MKIKSDIFVFECTSLSVGHTFVPFEDKNELLSWIRDSKVNGEVYLRNSSLELKDMKSDGLYLLAHLIDVRSKQIFQIYKDLTVYEINMFISTYYEDYSNGYIGVFEMDSCIELNDFLMT